MHQTTNETKVTRGRRVHACTLALTLAATASTGCAFVSIRHENVRLAHLTEVRGDLSAPASVANGTPLVVVVRRLHAPPEQVQATAVLYRSGPFRFLLEPASYSLFAFADENKNLRFDEGEPSGPTAERNLTLEVDEAPVHGLDLALTPGGPRPMAPFAPEHSTVVRLDEDRLSRGNGSKGMWAPGDFLAKNGDDVLYFLEPYDPTKMPVVFVHGIGGCPQDLQPFIEKLDRTRFQPWLFWYASGKRLAASAQSLRRVLDEARVVHDFERVVVVAQSVGGLVAREGVSMLQEGDHRFSVEALVTLSTPWRGHEMADLGVSVSLLVLPAWYDIQPDSDFQRRQLATNLQGVRHYLFFSYGRDGNGDGSVALSSELDLGMQRQATEVLGFPETHMGIVTNVDALRRFEEVLTHVRETSRAEWQGERQGAVRGN